MKRFKLLSGYAICMLLLTCTFFDLKAQISSETTLWVDSISFNESLSAPTELLYISSFDKYGIANTIPMHTIHFTGDSTEFWLDMSGDSLVWGGEMELTESAKTFIKFCDEYVYSKIDSLKSELNAIRKKYGLQR